MGNGITSRWLNETGYGGTQSDVYRQQAAIRDEEDVRRADQLILLAELPGINVPGGKHVETGIAIALGKKIHVIGRRENIFHWHPLIDFYSTIEEFLNAIK